jgi:hypothetical protein
MNTSFSGIARTLYVRPRLRLAEAPRGKGVDWASVHGAVDEALTELATSVSARRGEISSSAGKTSGGAVLLFVYRTFRRADRPGTESIVAGVTFLKHPRGILARADVCTEDSGRVVGRGIERERVLGEGEDVEDEAANLAAHLARSVESIIAAVDSAPREPE